MPLISKFSLALAVLAALSDPVKAVTPAVLPTTIDGFTVDWFMQNTAAPYTPGSHKLKDTCLFYSQGLSNLVGTNAAKTGMASIWDIWGAPLAGGTSCLFDDSMTPGNPMSAFIQYDVKDEEDTLNPPQRIEVKVYRKQTMLYFARMSAAMAWLCAGNVRSIHRNLDKIPAKGIFRQVELYVMQLKIRCQDGCIPIDDPITGIWGSTMTDPNSFANIVWNEKDLSKLDTGGPFDTERAPSLSPISNPAQPILPGTTKRSIAGRLLFEKRDDEDLEKRAGGCPPIGPDLFKAWDNSEAEDLSNYQLDTSDPNKPITNILSQIFQGSTIQKMVDQVNALGI